LFEQRKFQIVFKALKKKFEEVSKKRRENPEVITYQSIRRAVGWLGLSLPFELLLGSFLFGHCGHVQPSISHYYYTGMREIFEGALCAVALFLFPIKGTAGWTVLRPMQLGYFVWASHCFPQTAYAFHVSINWFLCSKFPFTPPSISRVRLCSFLR
jgi:hypothetical protein